MNPSWTKHLIVVLYALAGLLLIWSIFTFLYQYIAALGSLREVLSAFGDHRILTALWLSVLSAFVTAGLSIVLGIRLAYVLAMKDFPGKFVVETLAVDVPQTFPPVAEGMIFLLMLGPSSPFHVNLAFTFTALIIAKVFICVPFVVSFTARRFREIRKTGINLTARSLGASPFQVFTSVFLVSEVAWVEIKVGMISVLDGITPAKRRLPPSSPIARDQQRDTLAAISFSPKVALAGRMERDLFRLVPNNGLRSEL